MKYNKLIRHYLVIYNLSQSDLAKICKVHKSSISRWLNDKELPEKRQLELIHLIQKEGEKREQ